MQENQRNTSILSAEITKRFKEFELNVSFSAKRGCLGILGSSGCGKSLTLKSIAGIIRPDRGKIIFYGEEAEQKKVFYDSEKRIDLPSQKRKVGYLFQNYALFPNMTVWQNVAAGLRMKNRNEKVNEMIERFQLNGLEKRYPSQLSGGQQQRVALARILAYEPDILLFDEPFSAMDTFLREKLRLELLQTLENYRRISVLVTHDRDEAYQLCDRLMLLDHGKILAYGSTKDIFANPGNCQAARLTGCKNISRIVRLGAYRVRALDWRNLELTTDKAVDDDITAIGIRAHDFKPFCENEDDSVNRKEPVNLIPIHNAKITETPFEWYIILDNGLWWKVKKAYIHIQWILFHTVFG